MPVDAETVRRVAHLARIAVADDEVEALQGELNAMLALFEQLGTVNVDGVEPMTSVTRAAARAPERDIPRTRRGGRRPRRDPRDGARAVCEAVGRAATD